MQLNGRQVVADGAGGAAFLFEDSNGEGKTVIWINQKGKIIFRKTGVQNLEILAAKRNALYLRGLFDPDAENSILAVSRSGEESDLDSIGTIGEVYFDFNDQSAPVASSPFDDAGFFAFGSSPDPAEPDSAPLIKLIRFRVR